MFDPKVSKIVQQSFKFRALESLDGGVILSTWAILADSPYGICLLPVDETRGVTELNHQI